MSWDRSRAIPWTRLSDVSGDEYESKKERVFRSLVKEANAEKEGLEKQITPATTITTTHTGGGAEGDEGFVPPEVLQVKKKKGLFNSGVDYSTPDFVRSLAFGGCIGSITGAVFGFMDGMRTASDSPILKNASNMAKSRFLMQGTTRTGMIFGGFFSGFHALKYGIRVAADPGQVAEIVGAGTLSIGALVVKPATRAHIPYAGMLIAMDSFSLYMNQNE
jgi:hypothetical protein